MFQENTSSAESNILAVDEVGVAAITFCHRGCFLGGKHKKIVDESVSSDCIISQDKPRSEEPRQHRL